MDITDEQKDDITNQEINKNMNRRTFFLFLAIMILAISACKTSPPRKTETLYSRHPKLNFVSSADIGDDIYKYSSLTTTATLEVYTGYTKLTYSGMNANNELLVKYSERDPYLMQPLVEHDVSYPYLPDGKTIVKFKGVEIEVIEATNALIKYVVKSRFTKDLRLEKTLKELEAKGL